MPDFTEKTLAPGYYLEHFESMLQFVEQRCAPLLGDNDRRSLRRFANLSRPARLLFVRLFNRKGRFFRLGALRYAEISDLESAAAELTEAGLVRAAEDGGKESAAEALDSFSAAILRKAARDLGLKTSGLTKGELVQLLVEAGDTAEVLRRCNPERDLIECGLDDRFEYFKFLFFGDIWTEMTEFVLRDLREVRYAGESSRNFELRFANREAAEREYRLQQARQEFREKQDAVSDSELLAWLASLTGEQAASAEETLDRLLLEAAKYFADREQLESAMALLERTNRPPAREQRVRLLVKAGRSDAAAALAEEMRSDPKDPREEYFAVDFLRKRSCGKSVKSTRAYLKRSETIVLHPEGRVPGRPGEVEAAAVEFFESRGWQAFHTENSLWRALFGLLFWQELYGGSTGIIHSPFQLEPILPPRFTPGEHAGLAAALALLEDKTKLLDHLEETYFANLDTVNAYVYWRPSPLPLVAQCCNRLSLTQLRAVLCRMFDNGGGCMSGFPDLFCYRGENDYVFVEVKGPNDELSASQLAWLRFFEEHGINARAVKGKWERRIKAKRLRSETARVEQPAADAGPSKGNS